MSIPERSSVSVISAENSLPDGERNMALDFTKGALVLLMVLYHWMNYFVSTVGPIYTYLRFITPAFIFIAGFLICNIYPERYGIGDLPIARRLFARGAKLLVLFTLLNLSANAIFTTTYKGGMPGVDGFVRNAASVYVSGNARSAFWVLLPISYLLLLSAGLFLAGQANRKAVSILCVIVVTGVLALNHCGYPSANLELVAIGLLGMVCGTIRIKQINACAEHPCSVVGAYGAYMLVISIWGVPYVLQIVGVCLSVLLIYLTGLRRTFNTSARNQIILLGQYSLFGYVAQIGILHFLHRWFSHLPLHAVPLWMISFTGAFVLTIVAVNVVHVIRGRSPAINTVYKLAFS